MNKVEFVRVLSELLSKLYGQKLVEDHLVERLTEIAEFNRALEYEEFSLIMYGVIGLSDNHPSVQRMILEEGLSLEEVLDGIHLNFKQTFVYPFQNEDWKNLENEYEVLEVIASSKLDS